MKNPGRRFMRTGTFSMTHTTLPQSRPGSRPSVPFMVRAWRCPASRLGGDTGAAPPTQALGTAQERADRPGAPRARVQPDKRASESPVSEFQAIQPLVASVPFMITAAMKVALRELGHTDAAIHEMTPAKAHELVDRAGRGRQANPVWMHLPTAASQAGRAYQDRRANLPPPIQPWHSSAFHAASVITTWMTSIIRPPAFTVSGSAVASPSRTRSASLCRSRV